jgi:hypothetical protein
MEVNKLADVGAGDKRFLTRSRENDRLHFGIVAELPESGSQFLDGLDVHGVQLFGTVDRNPTDPVALLNQEILKIHRLLPHGFFPILANQRVFFTIF